MTPRIFPGSPFSARVKALVSVETGVSVRDMESDFRAQEPSWARFAAMWIVRHAAGASTPAIGRMFGDRDHTTVIAALRRVERERRLNPDYAHWLDVLMARARGLAPIQSQPPLPTSYGLPIGLAYRVDSVTFNLAVRP